MRLSIALGVLGTAVATFNLLGCAGTLAQDAPALEGAAGDFTAMTTDGSEITGESFIGNVTIVDFWAVF